MTRSLVLAITLLLMQAVAFAQNAPVPNVMNFQGRLAKPDGTPVPDGNYTLRFSLWDAPSAGTEKWNQTYSNVPVRNGIIAILIGLLVPSDFPSDRWLEIMETDNADGTTGAAEVPAYTVQQEITASNTVKKVEAKTGKRDVRLNMDSDAATNMVVKSGVAILSAAKNNPVS